MKNRIISVCLTLATLVSCFAVPVFADGFDETNWIDLVDYGTANDSGSNRVSISSTGDTATKNIVFTNPNGYSYGVVEVLFSTDDTSPELGTSSQWLTIEHVFGNTYRAYGSMNNANCRLTFRYTDASYIQIYSFKVAVSRYDWDYLPCTGEFRTYDNVDNHYLEYTNTAVGFSWTRTSDQSFYNGVWSCTISFPEWRKYDYIDVILTVRSYSISQVIADWAKGGLNCTITELNQSEGSGANVSFAVRIDLRTLDKYNSYDPVLRITGDSIVTSDAVPQNNYIAIGSCIGYVQYENVDLVSYWFMQLEDWIGSMTNSIVSALGGNADTSEMENEVGSLKDQVEDANNALNEFTRPAVEDVITDVDLDIGTDTPFADMMRQMLENDFIVSIITGSLAFTLFGILVG